MTEPPPSSVTPFGPGYSVQATTALAGFWRRLGAYLIDAIILGVIGAIIQAIIGAITQASATDTTGVSVRGGLVTLVLYLVYFGYLWSRNGQSIGYMALGIRLVRTDGTLPSFGLALVRALLVYLSFALCLIPAIISTIMISTGDRKQAIHDVMVGTLVVRA